MATAEALKQINELRSEASSKYGGDAKRQLRIKLRDLKKSGEISDLEFKKYYNEVKPVTQQRPDVLTQQLIKQEKALNNQQKQEKAIQASRDFLSPVTTTQQRAQSAVDDIKIRKTFLVDLAATPKDKPIEIKVTRQPVNYVPFEPEIKESPQTRIIEGIYGIETKIKKRTQNFLESTDLDVKNNDLGFIKFGKTIGQTIPRTVEGISVGGLNILGTGIAFTDPQLKNIAKEDVSFAIKTTPKILKKTFDPKTPEGLANIALTTYSIATVGSAKSAKLKIKNAPILEADLTGYYDSTLKLEPTYVGKGSYSGKAADIVLRPKSKKVYIRTKESLTTVEGGESLTDLKVTKNILKREISLEPSKGYEIKGKATEIFDINVKGESSSPIKKTSLDLNILDVVKTDIKAKSQVTSISDYNLLTNQKTIKRIEITEPDISFGKSSIRQEPYLNVELTSPDTVTTTIVKPVDVTTISKIGRKSSLNLLVEERQLPSRNIQSLFKSKKGQFGVSDLVSEPKIDVYVEPTNIEIGSFDLGFLENVPSNKLSSYSKISLLPSLISSPKSKLNSGLSLRSKSLTKSKNIFDNPSDILTRSKTSTKPTVDISSYAGVKSSSIFDFDIKPITSTKSKFVGGFDFSFEPEPPEPKKDEPPPPPPPIFGDFKFKYKEESKTSKKKKSKSKFKKTPSLVRLAFNLKEPKFNKNYLFTGFEVR